MFTQKKRNYICNVPSKYFTILESFHFYQYDLLRELAALKTPLEIKIIKNLTLLFILKLHRIFATESFPHLRLVFQEYHKLTGQLKEFVKSGFWKKPKVKIFDAYNGVTF